MAETLLLAYEFGRSGWDVAHAGSAGAFALAAVGQCFVQRRLLFDLLLLWRLRRLWRSGMTQLDPRALRLAVCVDRRVAVSGARVDITLAAPADGSARPMTLVEAALPFAAVRARDPRLPAAGDGLAWRVHALAAEGVAGFRQLARALAAVDRGAHVALRAAVRRSRSPAALRAAFPLRIDLQLDADEGYVTLVPLRELVLADR